MIYHTKIFRRIQDRRSQFGPVRGVFVTADQGLLCKEIKVRASGGPIAFQSPSVPGKDTSKTREIFMLVRDVRMLLATADENSHEPEMMSKAFTNTLGSEPNVRDVDCARLWTSVIPKL